MPDDPDEVMRQEAKESLERIQAFDTDLLPRENDLGKSFAFHNAVAPAQRLVELYNRLGVSALDDLPQQALTKIQTQANTDYNRFDEILRFDPEQQNAKAQKDTLITQIGSSYQTTFNALHPYISYSLHRTADFKRLESDARAALQAIRDQADDVAKSMAADKEASEQVLKDIRKVAEEQGVTQQAIYFGESAAKHETLTDKWRKYTIRVAIGLGVYAFLSLFLHHIPGLDPANTYQAIQVAVSKVLMFTVISYMLYLCARNFMSHKHNAIVDRHRQNALMTYKALVDAAGDSPNKEVILVQAAACIFAPQNTGYGGDSAPQQPGAKSVVEFLSKPLQGD